MKFSLELIGQPSIEPITLTQLKSELRTMTGTTEDAKLTRLITAGRQWFEEYTNRALIDQTWRLCLGQNIRILETPNVGRPYGYYCGDLTLLDRSIRLYRAPALAIVSVYSVAVDGTRTQVAEGTYQLRDSKSKWPEVIGLNPIIGASEELQIEFRAGYADRTGSPTQDASVVPSDMIQAIYLWIEAMYDKDEKMMERMIRAAEHLADRHSIDMKFA